MKSFALTIPFIKNQFHINFGDQIDSNKNCFQLYGIDILLDENFNPWVLEINSNPSFNINIQKFEKVRDNFKLVTEVSEIDKHIKTIVITDAFKVLMSDSGQRFRDERNQFKKIFPLNNTKLECFSIIDDLRKIFEGLAGHREFSGVSSS